MDPALLSADGAVSCSISGGLRTGNVIQSSDRSVSKQGSSEVTAADSAITSGVMAPQARVRFIGILNQEAHAGDVWPIAAKEEYTLNATADVPSRIDNAKHMLRTFPQLNALDQWFVDRPNNNFHHVGGDFNDRLGAWPHCYFVFSSDGKLVYRSAFRTLGPREHFIDIKDLQQFLEELPVARRVLVKPVSTERQQQLSSSLDQCAQQDGTSS